MLLILLLLMLLLLFPGFMNFDHSYNVPRKKKPKGNLIFVTGVVSWAGWLINALVKTLGHALLL